MGMPSGMELIITLVPFLIILLIIGIIFSLHKLADVVRSGKLPQTFINKIWIWTLIIPVWNFIAFIVINLNMDTAIRALESDLDLSFKAIGYPAFIGWCISLSFLYLWIPIVGLLVLIAFMIIYLIQILSTIRQVSALKHK